MTIKILLLSDIHGNYPALSSIAERFELSSFKYIVNCGDSLVYAPFANETLQWLQKHKVISILGNTDKKVIKLLKGKSFKKPRKKEKRIMYTSTAEKLNQTNTSYLLSLKKTAQIKIRCSADLPKQKKTKICLFHGSPADPDEFLFDTTPKSRFMQLAEQVRCDVIITGHSHTPYCKTISGTTFINPGSVGRMFDKDPRASCATLDLIDNTISVQHFRISYQIDEVIAGLIKEKLPSIYMKMYKSGEKLN